MRTETFQTARELLVHVKLPRGDVHVETADVTETTVTLSGGSARAERQIEQSIVRLDDRGDHDELLVDVDPQDLGLDTKLFKISITLDRRDPVDVRIVAPHGTNLRAVTGSADIRATGRFGDVDTRTASGDIAVGEVDRDAAVRVASGDVRIKRVGASLKAQTAAGDVIVGPVGGDAEVKSAAGDVQLEEVGGSVRVHSASGDVRVGSVAQGSVDLKSVSGDMLVGVRRGSRVWMDVKTITGDATSELDVGGEDDDAPLVELKATAMSGDIKIVRA